MESEEGLNRAEYLESVSRKPCVCRYCGKTYKPKEVSRTAYCSRDCYFAHKTEQKERRRSLPKESVYAVCPVCKETFIKRHSVKYCSDECRKEKTRQEYRKNASVICLKRREAYEPKEKEKHICGMCGAIFASAYRMELYCSEKCRKLAKVGRKDARNKARKNGVYYEYVNPLKVFKRDGWRCQLCGKKLKPKYRGTIRDDAPELDHIIPWAQGGEHSYKNTQCACRKCNIEKGARERGQLRLFG